MKTFYFVNIWAFSDINWDLNNIRSYLNLLHLSIKSQKATDPIISFLGKYLKEIILTIIIKKKALSMKMFAGQLHIIEFGSIIIINLIMFRAEWKINILNKKGL